MTGWAVACSSPSGRLRISMEGAILQWSHWFVCAQSSGIADSSQHTMRLCFDSPECCCIGQLGIIGMYAAIPRYGIATSSKPINVKRKRCMNARAGRCDLDYSG